MTYESAIDRNTALDKLRGAGLLREAAYVGGEWIAADDGRYLTVADPADGNALGTVPNQTGAETRRAIDAAEAALSDWKRKTAGERGDILLRWHALVQQHQEELAWIMTLEQGRPLAAARAEVAYAATFIRWYSEEGRRVYGDIIPQPQHDTRTMVLKEPIGVCGAITPWNMPSAMVTRKVSPALAAGCTVVLKPAEETPYSALALAYLAEKAGLPPGVLNVVTGDPAPIGLELTTHPTVRKITFTGSTDVGRLLLHQCADSIKKVSLELGGNSPFIIFDDADPDVAINGLLQSKFRNSGQTCVCANRILVQRNVYDAFLERFAQRVSALKVGNGFTPGVDQGPLINKAAVEKVESHVADALSAGATLVAGGQRSPAGNNFYLPTVLANVSSDMRVSREETFGPVAPLTPFDTEDEAVALANDTEYGLAGYVYTRDIGRMFRVSETLDVGVVGVNKGVFATEVAPFGGRKHSGIGMEGSKYGIEEYLLLKRLTIGGVD